MTVLWTHTAICAAFGLGGLLVVYLMRCRQKQYTLSLVNALTVMFGCAVLPTAFVLLAYPFVDPKPDLKDHSISLLAGGLALVYTTIETVRQGLK